MTSASLPGCTCVIHVHQYARLHPFSCMDHLRCLPSQPGLADLLLFRPRSNKLDGTVEENSICSISPTKTDDRASLHRSEATKGQADEGDLEQELKIACKAGILRSRKYELPQESWC